MSDRIAKIGNCHQCLRTELSVSWHPASKTWYCEDCWPAIHESKQQERREAKMPTSRELAQLRDQVYGIRVEDDPHEEHAASFVVVCPEHGVLGDDLWILPVRTLRDNHELSHAP